jgi:glycosyltransferase involved in cell wall biosynthesis
MRIDLIWIGSSERAPEWPWGECRAVAPSPAAVHAIGQQAAQSRANAWLFWDATLGDPDPTLVTRALSSPGDVWHAGLRLGMGGLPGLLRAVAPAWMLGCDPRPDLEATSWRLSLRACLLRSEVLTALGGVDPAFRTLEGAALELGHRYVSAGALPRHLPWLLPPTYADLPRVELPFEEELRILRNRYGARWCRWAIFRAVLTGTVSPAGARAAWRCVAETPPSVPGPLRAGPGCAERESMTAVDGNVATGVPGGNVTSGVPEPERPPAVTVLIPTIDRYPYLHTLLSQLGQQTVPPHEIVVVDQTPKASRDGKLASRFPGLPLQLISQDRPGQCTARNAGLERATGEYVLFLDDDVEIPPTLIADHLESLRRFRAEVSCGVAEEVGAGPLPREFTFPRVSDVFPAGNTMIRAEVLECAGLFDLAYDQGQRADGDLGVRIYLSGALMVLNPAISVLHHRAPQGGLRTHKARIVTRASSRRRLTHRNLPTTWDLYRVRRYFDEEHVRELLWLGVLGTFAARGSRLRRMVKGITSLILLPDTLQRLARNNAAARALFPHYPQIPSRLTAHSSQLQA